MAPWFLCHLQLGWREGWELTGLPAWHRCEHAGSAAVPGSGAGGSAEAGRRADGLERGPGLVLRSGAHASPS